MCHLRLHDQGGLFDGLSLPKISLPAVSLPNPFAKKGKDKDKDKGKDKAGDKETPKLGGKAGSGDFNLPLFPPCSLPLLTFDVVLVLANASGADDLDDLDALATERKVPFAPTIAPPLFGEWSKRIDHLMVVLRAERQGGQGRGHPGIGARSAGRQDRRRLHAGSPFFAAGRWLRAMRMATLHLYRCES